MMSLFRLAPLTLLVLVACGPGPQGEGGPVVAPPSAEGRTETASLPRLKPGEITPDALKGLAGEQVSEALGAPSFRRLEAGAQIWQYRVRSCTLDLFLYEDGKGLVVAHYAVRAPLGGPALVSGQTCLDAVLSRATEKPIS